MSMPDTVDDDHLGESAQSQSSCYLSAELERTRAQLAQLRRQVTAHVKERTSDLATSEARLAALLQNLQDIVFVTDAQGALVEITGNVMGMLGHTAEGILAMPRDARLRVLVIPADYPILQERLDQARASLQILRVRVRARDVAGEVRWLDAALVPRRSDEDEFLGVQVVARDISEQVQAERMVGSLNAAAEAVQHASLSLEQVLAAVTDQLTQRGLYSAIGLVDPPGERLRFARVAGDEAVLRAVERMLHGSREECGITLSAAPTLIAGVIENLHPVYVTLDERLLRELLPMAQRMLSGAVLRLLPAMRMIIAPLVADNTVLGILAVAGDGISRALVPPVAAFANHTAIAIRNAQLVGSLAESEQQYRGIFEAAQDGMLVLDRAGGIIEGNPAAFDLFGYAPEIMLGMALCDLVGPDHQDEVQQFVAAVAAQGSYEGQWEAVRSSRIPLLLQVRGTRLMYRGATHWLVVMRDITEQAQAQEALVQAERLRALGQMAGGIAHDFNNILVSVRGYADAALSDLETKRVVLRQDLEQIIAGAGDAAEAIRRLQSLYRVADDTSDFVPLQLDEIVQAAVDLTRPHWRDGAQARGVTIKVDIEGTQPPLVSGNPSELRRVLVNLIVNAVEAMPQGGQITLRTYRDDAQSCITVCDTGVGIAREEFERVFEPFYSTKNSSGLGLAVSHNIIGRHSGTIEVFSTLGKGTRFTISIPATEQEQVAKGPLPQDAQTARGPLGVLVVDDEEIVRSLMARFLRRAGHNVALAESGRQALEILAEQQFDLLITDLGMPDISGRELAQEAHWAYPGMAIVLSTGWGATISPQQLAQMHAQGLLPKPFTHEELERTLRDTASRRPQD